MSRSRKHNALTKKTFASHVGKLAQEIKRIIEAAYVGLDPSSSAIAERRLQALGSFRYFAQTYFPHYIKHDPASVHDYLFDRFQQVVDNGVGDHDAIAAPRGHAKSTIITQIGTLWCVVTGRKHYPIIVMDALDQALPMLEAIKAELEFNPGLLMDFPEATGQGRVWQVATIVTKNDAKIEVFGSGKKIRGRRHGPHRPDIVIGDDLENDENVQSPEQRDKLEMWVKKSLLSLGAADDSLDVFIIGTILHYDSVLARLMANPLWKSRKFQAIERWPDNMQAWDKWQEIVLNIGEDAGLAYYKTHQRVMDAGAQICWPGGTTLYKLMFKRARDGTAAFDAEQQNDPISGEDAPFAKCIHFWVNRLASWIFFGACDPSLGKEGKSRDPSAILVGGLNRETGILDVVEAAIRKRLPDLIIAHIIEFQKAYRCLLWGIETVQFQEFLYTELVKRGRQAGVVVPARGIKTSTDKLLRIESMQPHMSHGTIRLHPSQNTLISQLTHFPKADHDDGPDCLQMLFSIATTGFVTMEFQSGGGKHRDAESDPYGDQYGAQDQEDSDFHDRHHGGW